jgi:hypothetical protein
MGPGVRRDDSGEAPSPQCLQGLCNPRELLVDRRHPFSASICGPVEGSSAPTAAPQAAHPPHLPQVEMAIRFSLPIALSYIWTLARSPPCGFVVSDKDFRDIRTSTNSLARTRNPA